MKKVTLSYAETRYRYGQLMMGEPSRFLEEIDEIYLDIPRQARIVPDRDFRGGESKVITNTPSRRNLRPVSDSTEASFDTSDVSGLQTGMLVEHSKFGKGKVVAIEGSGSNRKATVFFSGVGQKQLLLRFAKLKILS
jgi:DNA helicase-2/ATP-dependent DNA helicase PcrA